MARKLERAEQKHAQEADELRELREKMIKLRENCPHAKVEMREDGTVICSDCHQEVAWGRREGPPPVDHGGYGNGDDE